METFTITFQVPPAMDDALERWAGEQDVSVGQILRGLVRKEMSKTTSAKTPNRADEPLVARLQRLLVPAMAQALDWQDLQTRLAALGHMVKPAGGRLTVHVFVTGERLCKSSERGFPYACFVRKFIAPTPGHPHKMAHILAAIRDLPEQDADDFEVIERFSPSSEPATPTSRRSAPH